MFSKETRRVVAGIGTDGRSAVVSDEAIRALSLGNLAIAQMWTDAVDSRVQRGAMLDEATRPFRIEQLAEPVYGFMLAEYAPGLGGADPGMHYTDTIDHFHVIEGEVVLVLEAEEVVLRAGDSGVCLGVVHGWRNDGDVTARLVTFMLPSTRAAAA